MIPFRPTPDRAWEAYHALGYDNRSAQGYEWVIHPSLWADIRRDRQLWSFVDGMFTPDHMTMFGIPFRIDPSIRPGWLHLRHEVIA